MLTLLQISLATLYDKRHNKSMPIELFEKAVDHASLRLMHKLVGMQDEYTVGTPVASKEIEITKINANALSPFVGTENIPVVNGFASRPSDAFALSSARMSIQVGGVVKIKKLEWVSSNEFDNRLSSSVKMPTLRRPIYRLTENGIEVAPNYQSISLTYIKTPTPVKYAVKSSESGYVFDPDNSIEPKWNMSEVPELFVLMCDYVGIYAGVDELVQYIDKQKTQGI